MNSYKIWSKTVLWSIIVLVGAVVSINIAVDAYGILRSDFSRQFQVPNMNYIKIKYLLNNKMKFDSFVFGSSRVESIDVKKIQGGAYYNMIYPLGLPAEHLDNIKFLLKNGVTIRNVMIGIDEFSYVIDPAPRRSDLLAQPHPAVSGKKPDVFYAEYFVKLKRTLSQLVSYVSHNYTRRNSREAKMYVYDIYDSGRIFCPIAEEDIERNVEAHVRNNGFLKPYHTQGDNVAATLEVLKELVALAKENNIRLTIFINPIHKTTYLDTNLKQLAFFKKALALITDFYDFSGLNSVTTNNYYYYETLHYRPLVGDMMLKFMFSPNKTDVPSDFGFLVKPTNVDNHLRDQCLDIRRVRKSVVLTGDNTTFADSCDRNIAPDRGFQTLTVSSSGSENEKRVPDSTSN